jgi:hypothetical protein
LISCRARRCRPTFARHIDRDPGRLRHWLARGVGGRGGDPNHHPADAVAARIRGYTLNRVSLFALIFSIGILVRNSILLADFFRHAGKLERPLIAVLLEAGAIRFKPILLTALAAVIVSDCAHSKRSFVSRTTTINVVGGCLGHRFFAIELARCAVLEFEVLEPFASLTIVTN